MSKKEEDALVAKMMGTPVSSHPMVQMTPQLRTAIKNSPKGKMPPSLSNAPIKKTGIYKGKSNELGHGGRAQQLKDRGVPGGVIGNLARAKQAAPGQKNYHGKRK